MIVDRDGCVTCSDVAVTALVVSVTGQTATVEVDGRQEQVAVELVAPVLAGERLLCHAGIALTRLEDES
jgi:hydrogenase expression/formation protein HypC